MILRKSLIVLAILLVPALVSAVNVGQPAPSFNLPHVNGQENVELSKLRGKVVVVDFWASWCTPCLRAFPELDSLQRELGPRGVKVLAVSIDEELGSAQAKVGGGHAFTPLHDAGSKVSEQYGVGEALPATVVIDREGRVRFFKSGGAVDAAQLRRVVEGLL